MNTSKINAFPIFGGTPRYAERRQALGLSPSKSPRGGLRQGKGVTPYGC